MARWVEEELEKEPRTEHGSARGKENVQYWLWRGLHYWVAAWRVTAWYPKRRLKRNIPTKVCYTLRGVLRLPRGR